MTDVLAMMCGAPPLVRQSAFTIFEADSEQIAAYRGIRTEVFVEEQGLFIEADLDDLDTDPRTIVLVACDPVGVVLGGVRLSPVALPIEIGWWTGSRLAVRAGQRGAVVGPALVRAACARAEAEGALRFDATVQAANERLFRWLRWKPIREVSVIGTPHVQMRWPIHRLADLAMATKGDIAQVLDGLRPGGAGFVGDDGAPLAGTDVIATCDGIVPSMVERDPFWAGWCSVLVSVNDLAAMGAAPLGLLDGVAGRTAAQVQRILAGVRAASEAYGVPILGGHTQIGVAPSLYATALGRTSHPVPAGGGLPGDEVSLTVDVGGNWRPGYTGRQWDSTSVRQRSELAAMIGSVARARPAAAKDVSMAGIVGTLAMVAEASGCGAELDVARVPRPGGVSTGDWLTCFPGFGMLTADRPGRPPLDAGPATSAVCGRLIPGQGVSLVWPDGERTVAISGPVVGLGTAA